MISFMIIATTTSLIILKNLALENNITKATKNFKIRADFILRQIRLCVTFSSQFLHREWSPFRKK